MNRLVQEGRYSFNIGSIWKKGKGVSPGIYENRSNIQSARRLAPRNAETLAGPHRHDRCSPRRPRASIRDIPRQHFRCEALEPCAKLTLCKKEKQQNSCIPGLTPSHSPFNTLKYPDVTCKDIFRNDFRQFTKAEALLGILVEFYLVG